MNLLQPVHKIDLLLFRWCMARRRREMLTALGRATSKTADGWLYLFFAGIYGCLEWPDSVHYLQYFFIAFLCERLIYFVLKNVCRRNRPAQAIQDFNSFIIPSDKFSFPSGHTSAAFLFTVLSAGLFPALLPFLLGWAICVGVSRVFLGVHFPTDSVVGALLGSSVGLVTLMSGNWL